MDDVVAELEVAIGDAGALLVQLDKYQAPDQARQSLRRAVLALGDRARRSHHDATLTPGTAATLLGEANSLLTGLRELLATVREGPAHRAARAALEHGDRARLAELLPSVFAGIRVVEPPLSLHHAVPWFRRSRALPPSDVAGEIREAVTRGLLADGDELSLGRDRMLPAVVLTATPDPNDPVVLRFASGELPGPICRVGDGDEHLLHLPRLLAPGDVLVADALPEDALEATPVDYPRWRRALIDALTAAGVRYRVG